LTIIKKHGIESAVRNVADYTLSN